MKKKVKAKKKVVVHPRGKQHDIRAASLLRMREDCLERAKILRANQSISGDGAGWAMDMMAEVFETEARKAGKMR